MSVVCPIHLAHAKIVADRNDSYELSVLASSCDGMQLIAQHVLENRAIRNKTGDRIFHDPSRQTASPF